MQVPLLDLKAQYHSIKLELDQAVAEVLASAHFILGPNVKACEQEIAAYCQSSHAIGVSSGTDALLVALMAEGVGPGHEVITSAYSFFATAGSIARLGAKPVFVDIRPDSFNLDPSQVAAAVTSATRAIIPVHLFGQCADMEPLLTLAEHHNLAVIEDAAQAIGAEFHGRRAGSMGRYGCFSFFPSKNLGCAGDGGMVTTNDPARAEKVAILRSHGSKPKYYHKIIGGNFRLDELQAAIIRVKLRYLDQWTMGRNANARKYNELFADAGLAGKGLVTLPAMGKDRHVVNQYVIRVPRRDELKKFLAERQIGAEVYYPVPLHLQQCFAYLGYGPGSLPESERAARETLALPIYPELGSEQLAFIVTSVGEFFEMAKS